MVSTAAWVSAWLCLGVAPDTVRVDVVREVELRAADAQRLQFVAPRLRGIPVRGASRAVPTTAAGSWLAAPRLPAIPTPQVDPSEAAVGRDELPARVAEAMGLPEPAVFESSPTLVYLLRLGEPVLAWEVQLPLTTKPTPSRPTVWISAMTGRLLEEREQVRSARARVFAENPSTTPEPRDVELPRLGVVSPGSPLRSDTIVAYNCVEEPPEETPWTVQEGDCYPVHRALADDDGNFYVPTPEVIVEADNVQPDDRYAELSMFYHGAVFLDALRARGLEQFSCPQAVMLANVRTLTPDEEGGYAPLDNAYYTNQCDPQKGATMMFGQGGQVDFSYDGDVVYHELGHGVVALLTPEGLGGRRLREDGALVDAGAMNEAVADYMTYMMTDDPRVAEYVGRFWAANTRTEIRTGLNTKRCPEDTIGQVHNDGEPFAAALWSTRVQVGSAVDTLVLRTLPLLGSDATLEEGAAALLDVASQMQGEGLLDVEGVAHLQRALATRGLLDCPRVITDPDQVASGRTMHLRRTSATVQPFLPGPMQLRAEVPPGATALEVHFGVRGDDTPDDRVVVLVKHGEGPIAFTYALVGVDDPGDATGETGRIREVTRTDGDWDLELEPQLQPDGDWVARVSSVREGDVVHVALAAAGPSDLVASSVAVVPIGAFEEAETEGLADTDGDEPANDASVSAQATAAGGCGCTTGPDSAILLPWWMLPLVMRRRRPTRRPRAPRTRS